MTPSVEATRLARRLAALPDPQMRARVLTEHLESAEELPVVVVLDELLTLGRLGTPPFNIALLTLAETLNHELLSYERLVRLYGAAKEQGLEALLQLFHSSRCAGALAPREEHQRALTLGHRKWLARSHRREHLDRLLLDPEAEVISILLQNPRIVERDVVLLAARRPTQAILQREIFSARRWITRYAVKRALVLNPYSPTELSIRLLGFLNDQDLRQICGSPTLPEAVRAAARRLADRVRRT